MKDKEFLFPHENWFDIRIEKGTNDSIELYQAQKQHAKLWKKDKQYGH